MRTYGPPPRKDGTWSLADRSIIHILQIVGKRKMEIFRRKLSVRLLCLEKEAELSTF